MKKRRGKSPTGNPAKQRRGDGSPYDGADSWLRRLMRKAKRLGLYEWAWLLILLAVIATFDLWTSAAIGVVHWWFGP